VGLSPPLIATRQKPQRDAFITILLAGIPSNFRIALVAGTPLVQPRYRTARHVTG
jgi:hypothetical protein